MTFDASRAREALRVAASILDNSESGYVTSAAEMNRARQLSVLKILAEVSTSIVDHLAEDSSESEPEPEPPRSRLPDSPRIPVDEARHDAQEGVRRFVEKHPPVNNGEYRLPTDPRDVLFEPSYRPTPTRPHPFW